MNHKDSHTQHGNVLFLILIAVALFAALTFVVTKSTRTSGGGAQTEKDILNSAQMTQYPTSLRTSVTRMVIGGLEMGSLRFDGPGMAGFTSGAVSASRLVFHPQGGGATLQQGVAELSATGQPLTWTYNAEFQIPRVGIDGSAGNDIIAFLPGVSGAICRQTNEKMGIKMQDASPVCTANVNAQAPIVTGVATFVDRQMTQTSSYSFPATANATLAADGCTTIFDGRPTGCFYDVAGARHVFYSALFER